MECIERGTELPMGQLKRKLGIAIGRLVAKGRSGVIFESSCSGTPCVVKLIMRAGDETTVAADADMEWRLASWAATQKIGPAVYGPVRFCSLGTLDVAALQMRKLPCDLQALTKSGSLKNVLGAWELSFAKLERLEVQEEHWLCCDDIKAENILIDLGGDGSVQDVLLTDWDRHHWEILCLSREAAIFFNQLMLIFNTLMASQRRAEHLLALWPEHIVQTTLAVASLASQPDKVLLAYFRYWDSQLCRGPYHYAGISMLPSSTERALAFALALPSLARPQIEPIRAARATMKAHLLAFKSRPALAPLLGKAHGALI
jgi:hypothetical protein